MPVLNPQITVATGWSATSTAAAFSGAFLVSAVIGIPVGRVIDRRGPRAVMTTGSVLGVVAVLAITFAPNLIAFTAAWLLAGVAMAATFYQPAFAALTRWWGSDRVRALTIVTLAGGLASTAFAPLTATLAEHLSWRSTYAVLALLLALVTIPAHALALRGPAPVSAAQRGTNSGSVTRSRPFLMLATGPHAQQLRHVRRRHRTYAMRGLTFGCAGHLSYSACAGGTRRSLCLPNRARFLPAVFHLRAQTVGRIPRRRLFRRCISAAGRDSSLPTADKPSREQDGAGRSRAVRKSRLWGNP